MAWIKFEKDLLTDPRVLRIAKNLQARWKLYEVTASSPEFELGNDEALPAVTLVCGALVRIWCLADTHVGSDDVLPLGKSELDEVVGIQGFCDLMPPDWLEPIDEHSVKLPDFHSHNGTEAKKKAVTQKRVAAFRSRNAKQLLKRNARALPDQTKTRLDQTKEKEPLAVSAEALPSASPLNGNAVAYIPLNDGTDYGITAEQVSEFEKLYPAVNVPQTLNEIRGWNLANPQHRKTRTGVLRHVNRWLSKEQNRG